MSGSVIQSKGAPVARGPMTLAQFTQMMKDSEAAEELRQLGLTEEEVRLKLGCDVDTEQSPSHEVKQY